PGPRRGTCPSAFQVGRLIPPHPGPLPRGEGAATRDSRELLPSPIRRPGADNSPSPPGERISCFIIAPCAPEPGKDAFHRVPDFARNEWDAVERVLTRLRGRFGAGSGRAGTGLTSYPQARDGCRPWAGFHCPICSKLRVLGRTS